MCRDARPKNWSTLCWANEHSVVVMEGGAYVTKVENVVFNVVVGVDDDIN